MFKWFKRRLKKPEQAVIEELPDQVSEQVTSLTRFGSSFANRSMCLTESGQWVSWGYNSMGQCGNGSSNSGQHMQPITLKHPETDEPEVAIHATSGQGFGHIVTASGNVFFTGGPVTSFAEGDGRPEGVIISDGAHLPIINRLMSQQAVRSVACGDKHALWCDQEGRVFVAGPQRATGVESSEGFASQVELEQPIELVGAGFSHCMALSCSLGQVYTWGGTANGLGRSKDLAKPGPVSGLEGVIIKGFTAGNNFSIFLDHGGKVYACGDLEIFPNMKNSEKAVQLPLPGPVRAAAAGYQFVLWGMFDGRLLACGSNNYQQCGPTPDTGNCKDYQVVEGLPNKALACVSTSFWAAVALTEDGEMYGWGCCDNKRLAPDNPRKEVTIIPPVFGMDPVTDLWGNTCVPTPYVREWTPETHKRFPVAIRKAVVTLLLMRGRADSLWSGLPKDIIYIIACHAAFNWRR